LSFDRKRFTLDAVPVCPHCGRESEGDFAFCPHCGEPLTAKGRAREVRKTVTVLFCDVAGSTALGESVDPEALRALLGRYYERLKGIVEEHGGTVEKFVGDAVMAVFGVPVLHEDDATRAVRAAARILEALPDLGVEARIGINTGEVVTGTVERLATGDAVNVAARLEQSAAPGEVLMGAETARRVRDAVETEAVPSIELKGKSKPVRVYRLIAVREIKPRRPGTPMIGRERELQDLRETFARVLDDRSCQLFTIVGAAGLGKSRLAAEFVETCKTRVVRGRCLPYGNGITYWPVVEVVKQLRALPSDEAAAAALRSLLGESEAATSADEIAWSFRKLLEEQAREEPLVCMFDDLHWAEENFLDLVEHVAVLAHDAPILLLCMGRPELVDAHPGWGGGRGNARTAVLEPLGTVETDQLLDALGGVEPELRERISAAAEGNPLFLEEMVALMRESGPDEVSVPSTIQALLAARLDQLDPEERSVLERGAVEGRVFHRGAVQALSDGQSQLSGRLVALVRKDLVQPEPSLVPGDEAYRFRHILIRDAAYDALPKTVRAELHERFAAWLEERRPDLVELDEIVGHHLTQSARYKQELGRSDAALAERAAERVAVAGRRALWRGDNRAAASLLESALELRRPIRLDVALELDLATAQPTPPQAVAVAEAAGERALASGDSSGAAVARVEAAFQRFLAGEAWVDELEELALAALPLLEEAGDHPGLVHVWAALGYGVANARGRYAEWEKAAEQALRHARFAGQRPTHLFSLELTLVFGPTPADEALRKLDAVLPEVPHPYPLLFRSHLLAMLGRFEEAWPSARAASERMRELTGATGGGEYALAEIAALAGDHETATRHLQGFCDFLTEYGQSALLVTFAPALGRSLCALGRYDEAEPQAQLGREQGEEHDVLTQALWRQVQALINSHRGQHAEAEALAREAVAIIEQTDALNFQAAALYDLAEVLSGAGRADEAIAQLVQALHRYERKKNLAAAAKVRLRVAALQEEAQPA
jgi:class 3 adenylate cyclase/tetratricopeptide (TPR) repeat protein